MDKEITKKELLDKKIQILKKFLEEEDYNILSDKEVNNPIFEIEQNNDVNDENDEIKKI